MLHYLCLASSLKVLLFRTLGVTPSYYRENILNTRILTMFKENNIFNCCFYFIINPFNLWSLSRKSCFLFTTHSLLPLYPRSMTFTRKTFARKPFDWSNWQAFTRKGSLLDRSVKNETIGSHCTSLLWAA